MTEQSDTKKALESILGYEIPEEAVEFINIFANVATYDRTDNPGQYFLTEKSLIFNLPNRCGNANLLDLSGWWMTGSDGKSRFRLTDFMCEKEVPFTNPINVVITPISSKPCFATVLHSLVKNHNNEVVDVEIQVTTWDANGATAPHISFDWRCRVPIQITLL